MNKNEVKKKAYFTDRSVFIILVLLLLGSIYLSLRYGSAGIDQAAFRNGLLRRPGAETISVILYTVRLPRIAAALLAGVGLSVSGVLLQNVTANDLASPNIIGVNSGAGFMAILYLSFFPEKVFFLPFAAFLGAFLTTLLIVAVAGRAGTTKSTIILAGIAVTSILNAGISFISLLDADVLTMYNYFSIGGIAGVKPENLTVPAVIIAVSLLVSWAVSGKINLLCLGDSMAMSLGVRVRALRIVCFLCASASAAAVVSFAGLLGFVGLVVPHIARKAVGAETGRLLAASSLTGAVIVLLADLAGRVLFAPSELPVGIMMSVIGAPFFFLLLMRKRREVPC